MLVLRMINKIFLFFIILSELTLLFNLPGLTQTPPVASSVSSKFLKESRVNKRMNWGLRQGSPPISFQDTFGHWEGFCTDLIDLLDKYLKENNLLENDVNIIKYPISIQERFKHTRYPYQDQLHLSGECGSDSIRTDEKGITFSTPFFTTETLLLINKSQQNNFLFSKNNSLFNSDNHSKPRIGVIDSSITFNRILSYFNSYLPEIEIIKIKGSRAGVIDALLNNKVDALASDEIILRRILQDLDSARPNQFYIDSELVISRERYGLILPNNDEEWVKIINNFFVNKQADIQLLIRKDIPTPTPTPENHTFNRKSMLILLMIITAISGLSCIVYMYWFRIRLPNSLSPVKPKDPSAQSSPTNPLTEPPIGTVKKILILSANPKDTDSLRLQEEVREIKEALKRANNRSVEIFTHSAIRVEDLRRALLDHQPTIVHFSGHGSVGQGLVLENNSGLVQLVSTESLARLFKSFQEDVKCVLLNACYSENQAAAIHQHIDCVMGMNQAIGDQAAIKFAVGFYDALGAGKPYEVCFELGCASIDLEGIAESQTPVIKIRRRSS